MKLFYKLIKLKRGIDIQVSLTMRCTLDCPYCTQNLIYGRKPKMKDVSFTSWVRFFERFPYKIRCVYVSGGEPTIHPDFSRIVKYLLGKGYFVVVYTNLTKPEKILELPKCARLQINSTYHHAVPVARFTLNYEILKGYQIKVDEIGTKLLPFSVLKPMQTDEKNESYDKVMLRISPDLRINLNCYELFKETD